jgi:hypothetical protein
MVGGAGYPMAKIGKKASFSAISSEWHTIRLIISQLES